MKNRKPTIATFALFLMLSIVLENSVVLARGAASGEITGIVKDGMSEKGMEYVTVALYRQVDSTLVTGTVTNEEGGFLIKGVPAGNYYLIVDFLGYEKHIIPDVKVGLAHGPTDLGVVHLKPGTTQMAGVEVIGKKQAIEYHVDKDVINVDQQLNAAGGTAVEVLENHPSVNVDMDGNLTLRGSTDYIVLIDGKPTALDANLALQQMSAGNLKKIEVITNPSAKYDADSSAGIINLITNDNGNKGFSGLMNGVVYSGDSYRGDLSLGYGKRKLSFTVEGHINNDNGRQYEYEANYRSDNGNDGATIQNAVGSNLQSRSVKQMETGIDFSLNDKNTLSLIAKKGQFEGQYLIVEKVAESIGNDNSHFIIDNVIRDDRSTTTIHLTDLHSFGKEGHQLEVSASYFFIDYDRKNLQDEFDADPSWNPETPGSKIENSQQQTISRLRIKTDYVKPLTEQAKMEAGFQARLDQRDAHFLVASFSGGGLSDNSYRYRRDIYAAYYTLHGTWRKMEIKAGARAEYIDRQMVFPDDNETISFKKLQLFPSIHLTKKLSPDQQVQLNYSRAIVRPNDFQLNPFFYYTSRFANWRGNAGLEPSPVNTFEFNYNTTFGNSSLTAKGYYKMANNVFYYVLQNDRPGVTTGFPDNLDKAVDLGVEISGDIELASWWKINPSFVFYRNSLQGTILEQYIDRSAYIWRSTLKTTFDLLENTTLQLTGFYNGPYLIPQGREIAWHAVNASLRQRLFDKKLVLTLSCNNLFNLRRYGGAFAGEGFTRESRAKHKFPVYTFHLSYKFNNFNKQDREDGGEGLGF